MINLSTFATPFFPFDSSLSEDSVLDLEDLIKLHTIPLIKLILSSLFEKKVTDLKSLNFRKTYDIFSTPQIYLLDKDKKIIGKTVEVLIDAVSRKDKTELSGRTSGNTLVSFHPCGTQKEKLSINDWIGRLAKVDVKRAGPHSLWGEMSAD